jgi:hypothetical protein
LALLDTRITPFGSDFHRGILCAEKHGARPQNIFSNDHFECPLLMDAPLVSVAYANIVNEWGDLPGDKKATVKSLLQQFVKAAPSEHPSIVKQLSVVIGHEVTSLHRISRILSISPDPLPDPALTATGEGARKSNPWSQVEDDRLLAGINKYGLTSWVSVAKFVGGGRSRAQCSQRWNRSLNPFIKKTQWSIVEEARLRELVMRFGFKAWTRIADEIGTRSDIQCRYHWSQMQPFETDALPASTDDIRLAGQLPELAEAAREAPQSSIWDILTPPDGFDLFARSEFDDTLF